MDYDELLETIILIGKKMIEDGAEITRADDSIRRILRAYKADEIEVLAIPSSITVSAKFEGKLYTQMKRVDDTIVKFCELDDLNGLSRAITRNPMEVDELKKRFKEIISKKPYPFYLKSIGAILCAAGFSLFFGGDWLDMIAAAVLGIGIVLSNTYLKPHINKFVHTTLISFVIGVLGIAFYKIGFGHHLDKMLIGTVMLLIPGMALANGVRDLFMGETISGTIKIIESLLTAVCIAVGYGLSIYFLSRETKMAPSQVAWYITLFGGIIGATGFGITFHMRLRPLIVAVAGTVVTLIIYVICAQNITFVFLPVFIASLVSGIYGEIMSRYVKMPALCILTISVMPLYPGGSLYYTFAYLVQGNSDMFQSNIISTGYKSLGVAIGIVISSVAFKYIHSAINTIKRNRMEKKKLLEKQKALEAPAEEAIPAAENVAENQVSPAADSKESLKEIPTEE